MTSIYLFKCGRYHKIGISKNVPSRLKTIQTMNAHRVTFVSSWLIPLEDPETARRLESRLHHHYKEHRFHHEWFKLPKSELEKLKRCDIVEFTKDLEESPYWASVNDFRNRQHGRRRGW